MPSGAKYLRLALEHESRYSYRLDSGSGNPIWQFHLWQITCIHIQDYFKWYTCTLDEPTVNYNLLQVTHIFTPSREKKNSRKEKNASVKAGFE